MSVVTEVELTSPDHTVCKTCVFDVEFAKQLVDDQNIIKDDRDKLKRMLKERKKGNELDTFYKLGKNCKHDFLGRWCALRGFGLQNLPHDLRSALANKYYLDVDIVNAQPTLLVQYCDKRGYSCDALKKYVSMREELLSEICDTMAIQRWEAKQKVVSILFGANASGMPEFFKDEFYPEIRKITSNIYKEHESNLKWLKNRPNFMGKGLSYILQTEERSCLEALDRALAKRGRSLDVYIHDGGLVRKKGDETTLPDSFLRELEKDIESETEYSVKLIVKPLDTSFEFTPKSDGGYSEMKEEFEKEYMKLMSPAMYIRVVGEKVETITQKELIHQKQNLLLPDGKTMFITQWVKDPTIRTYERLAYAPKLEVADNEYNLFTKFAVDPVPVVDISPILMLISLACNHDVKVIEYVLNCLAQMIQTPFLKLLVCLIFQGKEGIGKDTIIEFFGKILGVGYYFSTKSPESNVFHNFNSGTERCILVKFEEADFKTNKQNASKLKALITQQKETYIRKGHDGVELNDYRNFMMTTNDEIPILLGDDSRRFVLIKSSDEKKGDSEFWNEMYSHVNNPNVQAQFHQFLLDRDISNFNAPRDRVITDYYRDTKQSLAPYHAKFFQELIQNRELLNETLDLEENPSMEYKAIHLYNLMKEAVATKFELNQKQFGTNMKIYVEANCIIKKDTRTGATYTVYPELCKQFLKKHDWFVDI